jgi:hypothetical protein
VAERQLPKLNVAGSIPVSRSMSRSSFFCAIRLAYAVSCIFITRLVIVSSPTNNI